MIVKYFIDDEILTDRNSLCNEFNLSKTKLHHLISNLDPSFHYKGFYLYKYDQVIEYLKKNEKMSETFNQCG